LAGGLFSLTILCCSWTVVACLVQSHASSTTNHLGLGTGRRVAGDAGGKKAAVMMHDGDRGDKGLDGVDLELRLCR
jgi:hypothetical protein